MLIPGARIVRAAVAVMACLGGTGCVVYVPAESLGYQSTPSMTTPPLKHLERPEYMDVCHCQAHAEIS
jgi:hypothetical protein